MIILKVKTLILVLALYGALGLNLALCEPNRRWPRETEIQIGSTKAQIASTWGDPVDRVEKEILRQEVWSYRSLKIYFQDGVVSAVGDKKVLPRIEADKPITVSNQAPQQIKFAKPISGAGLIDILQDISKASSSGSSSIGGAMPGYDPNFSANSFPNNNQAQPPPLPFNFPTPQMGQPFGFPVDEGR